MNANDNGTRRGPLPTFVRRDKGPEHYFRLLKAKKNVANDNARTTFKDWRDRHKDKIDEAHTDDELRTAIKKHGDKMEYHHDRMKQGLSQEYRAHHHHFTRATKAWEIAQTMLAKREGRPSGLRLRYFTPPEGYSPKQNEIKPWSRGFDLGKWRDEHPLKYKHELNKKESISEANNPKFGLRHEGRPYRCLNCDHEKLVTTNHTDDCYDYCPNCSWKPSFGKHGAFKIPGLGGTFRRFTYAGKQEGDQEH